MQGHATRRQIIAGVLAPRGVRVGTDAGRTWAAEGRGRRLIFCTRNRTDPISGFAKNGDAPVTIPPMYYFAYLVGSWLLDMPTQTLGVECWLEWYNWLDILAPLTVGGAVYAVLRLHYGVDYLALGLGMLDAPAAGPLSRRGLGDQHPIVQAPDLIHASRQPDVVGNYDEAGADLGIELQH